MLSVVHVTLLGHCIVFLGRVSSSQSAPFHSGVLMGTDELSGNETC